MAHKLDRAGLERVVAENDKRRFTLFEDSRRIRAAQAIRWPCTSTTRPCRSRLSCLTAPHATLDAIFAKSLTPGRRQHVHLSADPATAQAVEPGMAAPWCSRL